MTRHYTYRTHEVEVQPQYVDALLSGEKRAEVRVNDRDYQRGDRMLLTSPEGGSFTAVITHVLPLPHTEFGAGLVVLSIAEVAQ